jgi:nicotinate-nucleotide pyrophosphorylase (carboxylating)
LDRVIDELDSVIRKIVADALAEDIGGGGEDAVIGATIIAQESMVVAGRRWVDQVFTQLDDNIVIDWYISDSETAEADDVICKLVGPERALRSGEHTALNFLQIHSAAATTRAKVDVAMVFRID